MYWPAGRVDTLKAPCESLVAVAARGPVTTGGGVKWLAPANGAELIRTCALATGLPVSSITVPSTVPLVVAAHERTTTRITNVKVANPGLFSALFNIAFSLKLTLAFSDPL